MAMNLRNRISSFTELGTWLPELVNSTLPQEVFTSNNWFTPSETARALNAWSALLTVENLSRWTQSYPIPVVPMLKNILVITAGNIPMVGFHDFLSVLISGNRFIGRLSSRDNLLICRLAEELIRMEPEFSDLIRFDDREIAPDAVIATGSNNSARYFQELYGRIPHIIRQNRSSGAILDGTETDAEMENLAADILAYYGLGCRSVSHVWIPAGYPTEKLARSLAEYNNTDACESLRNNIKYQKARLAMLGQPFTEAGNALLMESNLLQSPIGVVYYSFYDDRQLLLDFLKTRESEIQCLVGHLSPDSGLTGFGEAQKPELWQYADNIDTLDFLLK